MKKLILAGTMAITLGALSMTPAEARDGCGVHRFRANNGRCYWMRQLPPPPVFYDNYDYGNYGYNPGIPFGFGIGFGGGWGGGWHHGGMWPHGMHHWH